MQFVKTVIVPHTQSTNIPGVNFLNHITYIHPVAVIDGVPYYPVDDRAAAVSAIEAALDRGEAVVTTSAGTRKQGISWFNIVQTYAEREIIVHAGEYIARLHQEAYESSAFEFHDAAAYARQTVRFYKTVIGKAD